MTRTTDPDPVPQRPLGEKVEPKKPYEPEWKSDKENPQIQRNKAGQVRTYIPANERANWAYLLGKR